jgi:hypothetical protein
VTTLFFNGAAHDTDNNKLHNEKTPQPKKSQRYDRLKRRKYFKHRGRTGCFANSGYLTVFSTHIYFIILISMIAGNLVEIRLPKIQSRKCLRKYNFNEIRGPVDSWCSLVLDECTFGKQI